MIRLYTEYLPFNWTPNSLSSGSAFGLTSDDLISVSCDVEQRDRSRDRGSLLTEAVSWGG